MSEMHVRYHEHRVPRGDHLYYVDGYEPLTSEQREVLDRAEAEMREKGWAWRRGIDDDGRVCLGVAIDHACASVRADVVEWCTLRNELFPHIALAMLTFPPPRGGDGRVSSSWNDDEGRTFEDVVALLDEVRAHA